jgi:nucleoside-diphosphate-sugar epimerase
MSKVMVLGAGGWLGRTVADRFRSSGRDVIEIDAKLPPGSEGVQADIRDLGKISSHFKNCEIVVNCCGAQHPKRARDLYEINSIAPEEIYKACGARVFVHISSVMAYGENPVNAFAFDESSKERPITPYGKSKLAGDAALLGQINKTKLIILRPGVFYGSSPSSNLIDFLAKLKSSPMPIFSKSGMLRTYVDIQKVVDAIVLSEDRGTSGSVYLIGDTEPLSTKRFYEVLAEEMKCTPKIVRIPRMLSRLSEFTAVKASDAGFHLRICNIIGEFGRHIHFSSRRAAAELGFDAHVSSEPGLREMARAAG